MHAANAPLRRDDEVCFIIHFFSTTVNAPKSFQWYWACDRRPLCACANALPSPEIHPSGAAAVGRGVLEAVRPEGGQGGLRARHDHVQLTERQGYAQSGRSAFHRNR